MLIEPSEQEVATILDLLIRYLHIREWEINPTKNRRPSTLVKFLGVQWWGHVKTSLLRWRISCCISPFLILRKRSNAQGISLDLRGNIFLILGMLFQPIYWVTQKAASFRWAQNKRRLCNRSRLLCKLLCYLSNMIHQIQCWLKMSTADRGAVWILWHIPIGESHTTQAFRILEQNSIIFHR